MESTTIYLRTSLFSIAGDNPHVPNGIMALKGTVADRPSGGIVIRVDAYLDGRGRPLDGTPMTLFLPWAKVDHAVVHDA
jgi:hypothetical protein